MAIGVTELESLIKIAHAGTRGPLVSITEHRAPKPLFGFSRGDGIAA